MGWVPEDLRIVDGDSPDDARRKNMLEGAGFGTIGALVEGATSLGRAKKGLRSATEYIPENEKASNYFSKNKIEATDDLEEIVNRNSFKRQVDLDEVGSYNAYKEQYKGYSPEELEDMVIFGRDTEMYSPFESGIRSADDFGVVGGAVDAARISNNIDSVYGRIRNPISEGALKFSMENPGGVRQIMAGLGDELANAGAFSFRSPTGKLIKSKTITNAVDDLAAKMLDMPMKDLRNMLGELTKAKDGMRVLTGEGSKAVKQALESALFELADVNRIRAAALVDTSLAGQVADMAWGMRIYDGGESALRGGAR